MGLQSDIQTDVAQALDSDLADATYDFIYQTSQSEYDPVVGKPIEMKENYHTRGVFSPIENSQVDGEQIKIGDAQFLILENELEVKPEIDNLILFGSDTYYINIVLIDPAQAMWDLTARKV